jgi:hypothetical protein
MPAAATGSLSRTGEGPRAPHGFPSERRDWADDRLALALAALASLAYAAAALSAAARQPYWMDEVLAVWTARQPGVGAVWEALRRGAEFSPPLYHLLLRGIVALGGDGPVWLRLPSIAAVYAVALAAFVLARRRFSAAIACLALATCLSGLLFSYAVQARQYACVAACFALALVLWDGLPERRIPWPRALGIALLLATAIGMHAYAVLLAGSLGLMEGLRSLRHRRVRWPVVLAVGGAVLSILLWLPIVQAAGAYSRLDAAAPDYYARPTAIRLILSVWDLLAGEGALLLSPFAALGVALAARLAAGRPARAARPDLPILVLVLCALPVLVFAFAACVTGTFNGRYAIAGALGVALLVAQGVAAHPRGRAIACGLIALATGSFLWQGEAPRVLRREAALALVARAPDGLPIATGNGLRFLEFREGADDGIARRLVFLTVPDLDRGPDLTNDHQVQRWARIDPALPVRAAGEFLADAPAFLLFTDPATADQLPGYLRARGYASAVVAEEAGMRLERVGRPASDP